MGRGGEQRSAQATRSPPATQAYFDAHATRIQSCFRGFYSRKYVHSFIARKAYLERVRLASQAVREAAAAERDAVEGRSAEEAAQQARIRFHASLQGLHHLVSTAAQPGVLNSPFQAVTGTRPTVDGFPVEDHIQVVAKVSGGRVEVSGLMVEGWDRRRGVDWGCCSVCEARPAHLPRPFVATPIPNL